MTGQTIYSEKCVTSVITVTILRKDLMFMRSKTLGINVRVTPEEKEKLLENAEYCALSLSEYLRRLGLGKNVKAATDEKIYKTFRLIRQLKKDFESLERSEILHRISTIGDFLK
mgnify:FL=1